MAREFCLKNPTPPGAALSKIPRGHKNGVGEDEVTVTSGATWDGLLRLMMEGWRNLASGLHAQAERTKMMMMFIAISARD